MLLVGSNIPQVNVVGARTELVSSAYTDTVGSYNSRPFARKLTSSLAVFGYCRGGTSENAGTVVGVGISGTTITPDESSRTDIKSLISGWNDSSNSAINTGLRYSDTSIVIPKQGAVDGTNTRQLARLTYNSGAAFTANANNYIQTADSIKSMEIRDIDGTYGLMAWDSINGAGTAGYIRIAVCNLSGASVGTVYNISTGSSGARVRNLIVLDSTYAIVVYALGSDLQARLITMSGTTISSVGSAVTVTSVVTGYGVSAEKISSTLAYIYVNQGNYPTDNHIRAYPVTLSGGALSVGTSFIAVNNTAASNNAPSNYLLPVPLGAGAACFYSDPDDSYYPYFVYRVGAEFVNRYKLFNDANVKILDAIALTNNKILMVYAETRGTSAPIYSRIITLK